MAPSLATMPGLHFALMIRKTLVFSKLDYQQWERMTVEVERNKTITAKREKEANKYFVRLHR